MTTLSMTPDHLSVTFTRAEKIGGLIRDVHVPRGAVVAAEVVPDGVAAARGLRAPGLAIPGRRKVGTWRGRSSKRLVAVRGGRHALRLTLEGHRWDELLIDVDGPEQAAKALAHVIAR